MCAEKLLDFLYKKFNIYPIFLIGCMNKKLLIVPSYLVNLGSMFIIPYRTLLAFFSESKSVTVHINGYGEQMLI